MSRFKLLRVVTVPMAFVHIEGLIKELRSSSFDLKLAASPTEDLPHWQQRLQTPIDAISIPREISPLQDLKAVWDIFRYLRKEKFHIVHSSTPKAGLLVALAAFAARVPVRIHTFTGQRWATLSGPLRWVLQFLDQVVISLNTHCFADSPSQIDFLVEQGVAKPGQVQCIGSGSFGGVNTTRFALKNQRTRQDIENLEKLPPTELRFIYVGRIVADKGLNEALFAFDQVSRQYPNMQFILVGPDSTETDSISSEAKKIIQDNPRVFALGPKKNPEDYFRASDVLLIPSYREGFGTVIIEAAACGLPSLATRIPGFTDSVVDQKTGILVAAKSTSELVEKIKWLAQHPDKIQEMGQQAHERCLQEFDEKIVSQLTIRTYCRILEEIGG